MKKFFLVFPLSLLLLSCAKKAETKAPASNLDEPDRVLFERAMRDLEKARYTVARLDLQTLISTYPDSEFLPQAKYAMAESFYREATSTALTQAENNFKDYITFFPTSELADDAQMKIAMTHVKRLEKPDRDTTQAQLAEVEFKSFIESYPDSPLMDEAKLKLREVQEVLADGIAGIGNFYFVSHRDYAAAVSRYREVVSKYPDYSRTPQTLFSLADGLQHVGNDKEAAIYYSRIVSDHPLSDRVSLSKQRLTALNEPVPEANPAALARAQQQNREEPSGVLGKLLLTLRPRPAVSDKTGAASDAKAEEATADTVGPVRGGTVGNTSARSGATNDGSNFNIDPKVVDKDPKAGDRSDDDCKPGTRRKETASGRIECEEIPQAGSSVPKKSP
jgi:outer membrane protein assembly factor BamD